MKRLSTTVLLTALLTLPLAAETQKSEGFIRNIQNDLNLYGFKHVDASELTNQQLGALHLKLSKSVGFFGYEAIRRKQEIKVILGWSK
jgi:hypothetical protein